MKSVKSLIFGTVAFASIGLSASASAAEVTHTISSGDTLSTISQQYFGDADHVQAIADANGIANIDLIYAGEVLTFDDGMLSTATSTDTTEATATYTAEATTDYTADTTADYTAEATTDYTTEAADTTTAATTSTVSGSEASAKEWIANKESSGSYTATNGQYYGRYQLTSSYLNGDYSAANQEAVADQYVASRYGSWSAAQSFWMANGWY